MGYADKIQDLIQISEDEQNRIKEISPESH